jgi:hypothetical protein
VNLTNQTFVCTDCAGILRSIGHKLKSITASTFTEDELKELERTGGNRKADKVESRIGGMQDRYKMESHLTSKYATSSAITNQKVVAPSKTDLLSIQDDSEVIPFHNPFQLKFFGQYHNANLDMTPDSTAEDSDSGFGPYRAAQSSVPTKPLEIVRTTKLDEEDDFDEFQSAPAVNLSSTESISQSDPYAAFRSIDNTSSSVFRSSNHAVVQETGHDDNDPYAALKNMTLDTRRTSIFDTHTTIHVKR